jgi:GDP-L-fucose synthase
MKEEYLLTGPLEKTNEPYAIAKIAGIKMCESFFQQYGCQFFSVMPTNAYGPNDNYDLETSHVFPALIRKFHEAIMNGSKEVTVWGSGNPKREFIYTDDIADACLFVMSLNFPSFYEKGFTHLNVGTGTEISVKALAEMIASFVGFSGNVVFDQSIPDGSPRKVLDVSRINNLGWKHKIALEEGVAITYDTFVEKVTNKNARGNITFEKQKI